MYKSNKISLKFVSLLIVLLLTFTIFFVPFLVKDNKKDIVFADSVSNSYSYTGSNLFTFDAYFNRAANSSTFYPVCFKVNLFNYYETPHLTEFEPTFMWFNQSAQSYVSYNVYTESCLTSTFSLAPNSHSFARFAANSSTCSNEYFLADFIKVGDFNGNVVKLHIFTPSSFTNSFISGSQYKCFRIEYIDSNTNYIAIEFAISSSFIFDERTYYLAEYTADYEDGYSDGQEAGYSTGYSDGEDDGYSAGYVAGNLAGFDSGWIEGANDVNQYTFFNLIGAVIDAPISYFRSLFNFNLLGTNIANFLLALFTLSVIVVIVKKVI